MCDERSLSYARCGVCCVSSRVSVFFRVCVVSRLFDARHLLSSLVPDGVWLFLFSSVFRVFLSASSSVSRSISRALPVFWLLVYCPFAFHLVLDSWWALVGSHLFSLISSLLSACSVVLVVLCVRLRPSAWCTCLGFRCSFSRVSAHFFDFAPSWLCVAAFWLVLSVLTSSLSSVAPQVVSHAQVVPLACVSVVSWVPRLLPDRCCCLS